MIEWMHRLSRSWVATFLMGFLALSFIVWGIADVYTGQSATAVATVGSRDISMTEFQRVYRNFVRGQGQQMGQDITPEMAQRLGLGNITLQQMVSRTALDNFAAKQGIVTSDAAVVQYVHGIQMFRGPTGQFDHATFLRLVEGAGYREQDFIAETRSDLTRQQMTGAVEGNFVMPTEYGLALMLYINEKRAADYVIVSPDSAGAIAAPDDKALDTYVKANPARFSTPEYRDVNYAWITPADVAGQGTVTDAMIAQEYEAKKATYQVAEKRDLDELNFKTEQEARAAHARITGGLGFDGYLTERGLKPADIALGTVVQTDIPDAVRAKTAFALPPGGVSEPIKGTFGWVIIRASKVTPGISRALADVREELKAELTTKLAANKLVDIVNAFADAKSAGSDMDEAAKKAGMKTARLRAADRTGMAPDGTATGAPKDPEFLNGVFTAEVGEENDPFAAASGAYYVVKVNGITPPKVKPLDQVRAEAATQWESEKRRTLLAARVTELTAQAQKEKSLDSVTKLLNVGIQKSPALSRNTNDTMFSTALVQQLFAAKADGIVSGTAGLSGNYIIARVTGIAHPRPNPGSEEFRGGILQMSANVAGDFGITLANAARLEQGVKVNQSQIDSITGGGNQ